MTDEELNAIEARANAATEGPWEWRRWTNGISAGDHDVGASCHTFDCRFIAAARTDVPKLVAEVRRLRAENEEMRIGAAALAELNQPSIEADMKILVELSSTRAELAEAVERIEDLCLLMNSPDASDRPAEVDFARAFLAKHNGGGK
jgi:hypothetical protein